MYLYVVAAVEGHAGPPAMPAARGSGPPETGVVPVGLRHAVSMIAVPLVALCGADVRSWVIFARTEFVPRHPASCQRCGQLVLSLERPAGR